MKHVYGSRLVRKPIGATWDNNLMHKLYGGRHIILFGGRHIIYGGRHINLNGGRHLSRLYGGRQINLYGGRHIIFGGRQWRPPYKFHLSGGRQIKLL